MRTGVKRLVLTKETVRAITNDELGKVGGGVISAVNPAFGAGSGCAWSAGGRWFGGSGGGSCIE